MQKVTPPAPDAEVAVNSPPMEAFCVTELLCTFTSMLNPYADCCVPTTVTTGFSNWPTVIPPVSVPALANTRLLDTSMLWFQPWRKMPPPPWELFAKLRPSMRDGLQRKLLG